MNKWLFACLWFFAGVGVSNLIDYLRCVWYIKKQEKRYFKELEKLQEGGMDNTTEKM